MFGRATCAGVFGVGDLLLHRFSFQWLAPVVAAALLVGLSIPLGVLGARVAQATGEAPGHPELVLAPQRNVLTDTPASGSDVQMVDLLRGTRRPPVKMFELYPGIWAAPVENLAEYLDTGAVPPLPDAAMQKWYDDLREVLNRLKPSPDAQYLLSLPSKVGPLPDATGNYGGYSPQGVNARSLKSVDGARLKVDVIITPPTEDNLTANSRPLVKAESVADVSGFGRVAMMEFDPRRVLALQKSGLGGFSVSLSPELTFMHELGLPPVLLTRLGGGGQAA